MSLNDNIRRAKELAGGNPSPVREKEIPIAPRAPCTHLGAPTGETVPCGTCAGSVQNKTFACAVHGICTLLDCKLCPDYARRTFPDITTRHLLYHVYPVAGNGVWRRNVELLRRHLSLFNGARTVAVVTDERTDAPGAVREAFGTDASDIEFLSFPNVPALREVVTFRPLFERAARLTDPTHATFYGHAKGVTRPNDGQIRRWADALYELNLGRWSAVADVLRTHPCAGAFLKVGMGWTPGESKSRWHYSGSFYWLRNAELFARDWQRIDNFWGGIEPYPSLHFAREEAGCVFHTAPVRAMNCYSADYWGRTVQPALEKWRRAGTAPVLPAVPTDGLCVDLGGGVKPRGAPWVNVDRDPSADVVLDFERDPLPWPDGSVARVYSSHAFEHVVNLKHLLRELVRVCRVGAEVEIRVPHWLSSMAMCHDHKQVIPEEQVEHWCASAADYWFGGSPRGLAHVRTERVPSAHFGEARKLFPHFTDEQIGKFIPNTCHEFRYFLRVVER